MGYYNWGEQVGNSFMTMLAQNQQKKLEEKRLGMEKQRVDMAGRQLEDQLETGIKQRELYNQEIAKGNREASEYLRVQKMWEGIPNVDVHLNDDGVVDANIPARDYPLIQDMAYSPYTITTVGADGKSTTSTQYYQNRLAPTMLDTAFNNASLNRGIYNDNLEHKDRMAGLGIERQKLAATLAQNALENERTALSKLSASVENDPVIKRNFYYSNGKLKWNPLGDLSETNSWAYLDNNYANLYSNLDRNKYYNAIGLGIQGVAGAAEEKNEKSGVVLEKDIFKGPSVTEQAAQGYLYNGSKSKQIVKDGYKAIDIPGSGVYFITKDGKRIKAGK